MLQCNVYQEGREGMIWTNSQHAQFNQLPIESFEYFVILTLKVLGMISIYQHVSQLSFNVHCKVLMDFNFEFYVSHINNSQKSPQLNWKMLHRSFWIKCYQILSNWLLFLRMMTTLRGGRAPTWGTHSPLWRWTWPMGRWSGSRTPPSRTSNRST